MNTAKITSAAKEIERLQKAVKWLEDFGPKVGNSEGADCADVTVRMNFAGSCNGAKEVSEIVSQAVRDMMRELLDDAHDYCREMIEIHRRTIRHEASSEGDAQ